MIVYYQNWKHTQYNCNYVIRSNNLPSQSTPNQNSMGSESQSPTVELVKEEIPVKQQPLLLSDNFKTGLVLVDLVNGFCTVGSGNFVILFFPFNVLCYLTFVFFVAIEKIFFIFYFVLVIVGAKRTRWEN